MDLKPREGEHGNYKINKFVVEAFIVYWAKFQQDIEKGKHICKCKRCEEAWTLKEQREGTSQISEERRFRIIELESKLEAEFKLCEKLRLQLYRLKSKQPGRTKKNPKLTVFSSLSTKQKKRRIAQARDRLVGLQKKTTSQTYIEAPICEREQILENVVKKYNPIQFLCVKNGEKFAVILSA